MAKPFDATLNSMIDAGPGDWAAHFARLAGIPPGPGVPLDTDLATTVQADKVFRIDGARPSLLHLELVTSSRLGYPRQLMRYNTLINHQHDLPVETVLVLLRPAAQASDQTGVYRRAGVNGNVIAEFRYHVERVWERPVDFWLNGGVGLAPLALVTDEAEADLGSALSRLQGCLRDHGTDAKVTKSLLGSSYVLCGLRYERERIRNLFQNVSMLMEESTTYQEIIEKGEARGIPKGERTMLFRLGARRFGPPSPAISAAMNAITDPARLESLADRIFDATSWDDLLRTG